MRPLTCAFSLSLVLLPGWWSHFNIAFAWPPCTMLTRSNPNWFHDLQILRCGRRAGLAMLWPKALCMAALGWMRKLVMSAPALASTWGPAIGSGKPVTAHSTSNCRVVSHNGSESQHSITEVPCSESLARSARSHKLSMPPTLVCCQLPQIDS